MRLFRGKLCAALKAQDDIRRPQAMSPTQYKNLINQLGRKDWHVEIMEPYELVRRRCYQLPGTLCQRWTDQQQPAQ